MVVYVTSFEDFKQYVDCAKTVFYRVLDGEIRIYAGRVGTKIQFKNEKEKSAILKWLAELEQTKTVIEIEDIESEDTFFI